MATISSGRAAARISMALITLVLAGQLVTAPPAAAAEPVEWITKLPVNGVDQAIQVRGNDKTAPLLIVIHGGPGYAMIDLLHETMPQLENDFVTVNYDQRGAGLSYAPDVPAASLTIDQLAEDADTIRQMVLDHIGAEPGRRVYVVGHSMGTMIGLHLVAEHPDHYTAYIGVGQVVNVVTNEQGSYDFALGQSTAEGNTTAMGQLQCVGRPLADFSYPGCTQQPSLDGFDVTDCWMEYYGGDIWGSTSDDPVWDVIIGSPAYRHNRRQWWDGLRFSQNLFNDPTIVPWNAVDVAHDLSVPVYFFQGHHDFDTPWPLVEPFASTIAGPHRLLWFENSSHFPFFEEGDAWRQHLVALKDGALPADGSTGPATQPGPEPDWNTPLDACQQGANSGGTTTTASPVPSSAPSSTAATVVAANPVAVTPVLAG